MEQSLSGKTYVVTGATSGIGRAAAELLVQQGASVIGVGRSVERGEQAQAELQALVPDGQVIYLTADLAEQSNVRALAGQVHRVLQQAGIDHLDGLLNNAGTFYYWLTLTSEGFEMQWAVNHLAPFLLTHELLPLLRAAPHGRVVTVSSASHYHTTLRWEDIQLRRRYNGLRAYQQTKLANVLFTAELNRRLGLGMRAFAADPGLVNTAIGAKSDSFLSRWVWNIRRRGGMPAQKAAEGIVFLLCDPGIQDAPEVYWLHGQPKSPSPYAQEAENARRLWELSEKMCAIPPGGYGQ